MDIRDHLREATSADAPAIQRLIATIFAEYDCTLCLDDDPHLRDPGPWFRERGGAFWLLADEGGELVATVAWLPRADGWAELKCLYVRADHRGRGLGRDLSAHVIRAARAAGAERMILWSDTRFAAAHRLYEGMGFVRGATRELGDTNGTVEYSYRCSIF